MRSRSCLALFAAFVAACVAPDAESIERQEIGEPEPLDDTADDAADADADEPVPAESTSIEIAAAGSTAAAAVEPGCVASGTLAGVTTWLFFTRPDRPCKPGADPGVDRNAIDELVRLIRSVPSGGRIDGHIFSITSVDVAEALADAQTENQVDVRISMDGRVETAPTSAAAREHLDTLTRRVYCGNDNNTACIATEERAISHTKLFVFSGATTPDGIAASNVVWLGSANQTTRSGMKLYNNTVTIFGDTSLYTLARGYLEDLFEQRRATDYYKPSLGRGHLLASTADIYVSPEVQTDLVVNRLDDVTPGAGCSVRVMQAAVRNTRLEVVSRLVRMKRRGCDVSVIASTVGDRALAALRSAGIPVRRAPIHDKVFIVFGRFPAGDRFRVYTGSHNLSGGAAHRFDEIFVKLAAETASSHPIYDAYVDHFDDARAISTPF
jgi:hypothetical protein